ncbi:MAG: hypothetical protein LUE14_05450 [Clostridiales bacterium]|nr:hypothetical protein [Clostridiales bacterium]
MHQIVENRDHSLPYVILGYSLGTAIAYDLIQYGMEEKPAYAFLCARASLDLYAKTKSFALLEEDAFVREIQKMGGVDKRILNNRRFLEIYMQAVPHNDVLSILSKTDFYILFHRFSIFDFATIEAMSQGKMQSLIVIACKILRVIYKMLTSGVKYDSAKLLNDIRYPALQQKTAA